MTTADRRTGRRHRTQAMTERESVTPLELFFDLVFVFALTQVTDLMADDSSARGVARGMLIMAVLWWSWVGYAWLANVVRADEGVTRVTMFAAMTAMFVLALTIPESFEDLPGGLSGPVVFAAGYFAVRFTHLVMFWSVAREDPGLRRQLLKFAPSVLVGTGMLLIASQLEGGAQIAFWALAFAGDYLGTMLGGAGGWRLPAAGHFAERHGLIIIIALGESIVSIGIGVTELPISWPIVVASALGLTVSGCLWWCYFDTQSIASERALAALDGEPRARMGRDAYSYLHLPMVAGIVLLSLGLKKVLSYVGDTDHHALTDPLYGIPLAALYGGAAMFLLANVAFKWRTLHSFGALRLTAAVLLLVLLPLAATLPALVSLVLLTLVLIALIVVETRHYAEARDRLRHDSAYEPG